MADHADGTAERVSASGDRVGLELQAGANLRGVHVLVVDIEVIATLLDPMSQRSRRPRV